MSGEDSTKAPPCQNCGTPRRTDGLAFCANCGLPYPNWTDSSAALHPPRRQSVWEELALAIFLLTLFSVVAYFVRGYYLVTLDPVEAQAVVTSVTTGRDGTVDYRYTVDDRKCTGRGRHRERNVPPVGATIRVYYARADPCFSSYPNVGSAFAGDFLVLVVAIGLFILGFARRAFERIRQSPVT